MCLDDWDMWKSTETAVEVKLRNQGYFAFT